MSSMQIVFLFDLNAFNEDILKSETELHKKLLCLRLTCIRILTHYSTIAPHLKWGFKFFDSNGPLTQIMCKFSFPNVTLESFETLENEICVKYQRHISYLEAISGSARRNSSSPNDGQNSLNERLSSPIQLLQLALTQLLFEYQWNDSTELFSPSSKHRNNKNIQKRNMLFLVSRCAAAEDEFLNYFGVKCSINKTKFSKLLLSQSLQEKLIDKASILWVWLNTSERNNFLVCSNSDGLNLLSHTLRSLQGSLIPLCVLSKPNNILKINKSQTNQQFVNPSSVSYSSIVPFSTSFCQSITHPFYLDTQESCNEAQLVLLGKANEIPVTLIKMPMECNRKENGLLHTAREYQEPNKKLHSLGSNTAISSITWSKITLHFSVTVHLPLKANDMFLCLPGPSILLSSYKHLQSIIRTLLLKNASLFVVCESVCGLTRPGIFSPLSETSSMISILNPKDYFLNEADIFTNILDITKPSNMSEMNITGPSLIETIDTIENSGEISEKCDLKPFQMEWMEMWFEPNSSICKVVDEFQDNLPSSEFEVFHNKLKLLGTRHQKDKKKPLEKNQKETESVVESEEVEKEENFNEICKDLTYEKLISLLTETYDSALMSNGIAIYIAKKIIKLASTFFLQKSIISYEESTKSFMTEYFCTSSRKLIEKYAINQDAENAAKGINECQLQTVLALEMEALFPSENYTGCINNVTSLLGVMSFFSGATELSKFLSEVLMENYGHNLYDLLVEIGEELGIPVVPEEDSADDPMAASPPSVSMSEIFGSVLSSNLSLKSTSSTSSRSDNRKLVRKRSDICDTNKSRQILLPAKSPKRKRNKANSSAFEKKSIRYSPRLASKRKRERSKAVESKTRSVRRNLFPRDKKLQTPRTSKFSTTPSKKKKSRTPQAHHVLKTNYVPNTPAHKQNKSALQRRKSQMDLPVVGDDAEVAESPTVKKGSKDSDHFKLLQKLRENNNISSASDQNASQSAGCSYRTQHTPESKRRLSLKLFSKLLASPTARMGLKKCSKRLFEQVAPHNFPGPSKRMKLCLDPEDAEGT